VRSRLLEFQEENNALQSKITSLEVASHGATEQEKLIGSFINFDNDINVSLLFVQEFGHLIIVRGN